MVRLNGEKMSKSRGNLVFVSRLLAAGTDPMAIRLAILAHHYAGDWDWTEEGLAAAVARLARWRRAVAMAGGLPRSVRRRHARGAVPGAAPAVVPEAAPTVVPGPRRRSFPRPRRRSFPGAPAVVPRRRRRWVPRRPAVGSR